MRHKDKVKRKQLYDGMVLGVLGVNRFLFPFHEAISKTRCYYLGI